jgi:Flp pilus assembly secretin CpaC
MISIDDAWSNPDPYKGAFGWRGTARHPQQSMQKRFSVIAAVMAAQLATCPLRAQTEIKAAQASVDLDLGAGASVSVERPFSTVLIGDPSVIDFQAQDERSVLLKPLGLGATNLVFVDKEGVVITNLTIIVRNGRPI